MNLLSRFRPTAVVFLMGAIALSVLPSTIYRVQAQEGLSRSQAVTVSNAKAIADLAAHLKKVGARMYGAYWCPHCTRQKEMFGAAFKDINYVECDPRGENPRPNLCRDAGVKGYPTWDINGKQLVGVQSFEELAAASNFKGSRKF
jgi:protein-disulfide isomerase